ncbi:MAG: DUF4382 domain-containing protein [Rhodothermales bacterium]|nr:DUF4382 domain-containing protein [Rhodothermales bacterium]
MRLRKAILATIPLFLIGLAIAGCDASTENSGRIIVRMTDAPLEQVTAINVTVVSCEIINSATEERETIVSSDEAKMFNLLALADGISLDVCDQEVQLKVFDQLRVVIGDEASITTGMDAAPVTTDLHVASGSSSGLKFFFDEAVDVSGGETLDVLLDFVADESVVTTGPPSAPTGYVMTPVIRAVSAELGGAALSISDEEEVVVE